LNREELLFTFRQLLLSKDGAALAHVVRTTPWQDLVDALEPFAPTAVGTLLLALPSDLRAKLFSHLEGARQDALLAVLPREAVLRLFEQMPADDRADLFNRLREDVRAQLLPALAQVERDDILKLASYPDGTVGSVTTSDYASLSPDLAVADALAELRTRAPDKETIYVVYVLDAEHRLLGTLSLRELVLAPPDAKVADLMRRDPVVARCDWRREEATELIRRYDLLALPVVDGAERMIGIVTVDDAMDIEKEADSAQLARFGGTGTLGGPDLDILSSTLQQMFKVRVFWLGILTFFGVLTSTFVAEQEEILSKVIVLAAFIAPIVDMGGNTGSQSATLVIRAMALGDLELRWTDVWRVIRRELPVACVLGVAIAGLELVLAFFSKGVGWDVLMVVGLAMLVCTTLGGVIGALLPFAARRIGTDPATLSSPLITSLMDLLGVLVYFGLAYALLGHLLSVA
jgi:magnesium transporter